jgi:hypothetical protein
MVYPQQLQKVDAALALGALEPPKQIIANVRTIPLLALMAGTGVVRLQVTGYLNTRRQQLLLLPMKVLFTFRQKLA